MIRFMLYFKIECSATLQGIVCNHAWICKGGKFLNSKDIVTMQVLL